MAAAVTPGSGLALVSYDFELGTLNLCRGQEASSYEMCSILSIEHISSLTFADLSTASQRL